MLRTGRRIPQVLLLALLLCQAPPWLPSPVPAHSSPAPQGTLPLRGDPQATLAPQSPNYDEQVGLTFTDSFSSMKYNVTAVAQSNADGYGPAYLLNGLTNNGYWYQVGLSWNWAPGSVPGTGFSMNYEVFDPNGDSIFPVTGGGGLLDFSGPVVQGDPVSLSLNFSGGFVVMGAVDLSTGSNGSIVFSDEAGSTFVGLLSPSNAKGFFTGLMTEEYHSAPYYGNLGAVTYTGSVPLSDGFLWADEFSVSPRSTVFYASKFVSFLNPSALQSFSANGTTEYADALTLITGALNKDLLTLSFAVSGGGSGYGAPALNYTEDGRGLSATLTRTPTTYLLDPGTYWAVSADLPGSSKTERWSTQRTGGTIGASEKENLTYRHQFLLTFSYSVIGGGTGYSSPQVQSIVYGGPASLPTGTPLWVDAGGGYTYAQYLPGSSSGERWASVNASGNVTKPGTASVNYYHQLGLTLSYALVGGGSPVPPALAYVQFGRPLSSPITNSTTFFLDPGSSWSVPSTLSGSDSERWVALQPANQTALAPLTLTLAYQHQYLLTLTALPAAGGTVLPLSGWADAGASVPLDGTASEGWEFRGWNGTGAGSYSGPASSTVLTMDSPVQESAVFYPGLRVSAGSGGEVSYTFSGQSGTVGPNSSALVFAPPGTVVSISAAPSSLLYVFDGWTQGANATGATATVSLGSPAAIDARFALNGTLVLGLASAAAAILLTAAWLAIRRRRPRN